MSRDSTEQESGQTITAQLKQLVDNGVDADEAVTTVLAPYRGRGCEPLVNFVWPALLKLARGMQSKRNNESVRRNVFHPAPFKSVEQHQEANTSLRTMVFRSNGRMIQWDDLTVEDLEAKIAWIRVHIGTLAEMIGVMQHAKELIIENGVKRLGDIDDWPDLLRERAGADAVSNIGEAVALRA